MRIVFMGTPDFALVCLKALVDSPYEVAAVVTQPDRPARRGKKLAEPPVKALARQAGIAVLQPEKIRAADSVAQIAAHGADIFVVAAYGQILSQALLALPKYGAINVHASLLPKYRGASPIQQAIADGETVTGITMMQMDAGMDTGDMLYTQQVAIEPHDTGGSLHDKLCRAAPQALLHTLRLIEDGEARPAPQNHALATHAPLITKDMAHIDWRKSPEGIVNLIRAYNPHPTAFARWDGGQIKLLRAEISALDSSNAPGTVIKCCQKDGIYVTAKVGVVRIIELTPPGGKKMSAADFVRGRKIQEGAVFS